MKTIKRVLIVLLLSAVAVWGGTLFYGTFIYAYCVPENFEFRVETDRPAYDIGDTIIVTASFTVAEDTELMLSPDPADNFLLLRSRGRSQVERNPEPSWIYADTQLSIEFVGVVLEGNGTKDRVIDFGDHGSIEAQAGKPVRLEIQFDPSPACTFWDSEELYMTEFAIIELR